MMSIDRWLGIIGVVLGVVGIVTGYVFYVRGRKAKEPYWTITTINLITGYSSIFKDLEIRYKGNEIPNFTVSKVVVWNNGRETIDRSDLTKVEPLCIRASSDAEILDAKILKVSNAASNFGIELLADRKNILLGFDYLDFHDGAVIQIVHTGIHGEAIFVEGKIKGVPKILRRDSPDYLRNVWRERIQIVTSIIAAMTFFLILTALDINITLEHSLAVITALVVATAIWMFFTMRSIDAQRPDLLSTLDLGDEQFNPDSNNLPMS